MIVAEQAVQKTFESNIYVSSFAFVKFYKCFPYVFYLPDGGDNIRKTSIVMFSIEKKIGLKDFRGMYYELYNFMNSNTDKSLAARYRESIYKANNDVDRWERLIQDLSASVLL